MIPKFMAGGGAIAAALYSLSHGFDRPLLIIAALFLMAICITDTLSAKIPNLLTAAALLTALVYHGVTAGAAGIIVSLAGLALGFFLLFGLYLLGGMGAGDVKALAALGALIGPAPLFQTFLYMGLIGGVMALLHYALSGRLTDRISAWTTALSIFCLTGKSADLRPLNTTEKLRFPYAAAIALGYFSFLHWGGLVVF